MLDLPKGWIGRLIDRPAIPKAAQRPGRCCGTFWDNIKKCQVVLDLGQVFITVPFVFRAVPSEVKPQNVLSWDEGTAQSTDISFSATVHNEQSLESGFVVIPGLCAPRCTNEPNLMGGQSIPQDLNRANLTPGQSLTGETFTC